MEFVKCPECERSILDQAAQCPWCGTPVGASRASSEAKPSGGRSRALAAAVAAVLGAAALLAYVAGRRPAAGSAPSPGPPVRPTAAVREDTRFGLSEAQRRDVYQDVLGAEDHTQLEADRRYPPPDPSASSDRWGRYSETREQFRRQASEEDKKAISKRYGLTADQLAAIVEEGAQHDWPRPPRRSIR